MFMRAAYEKLKVRVIFALLAGFCCALFSGTAAGPCASSSAATHSLFDSARDLTKRGNFAEAYPKVDESQRLDPGSGTLAHLGIGARLGAVAIRCSGVHGWGRLGDGTTDNSRTMPLDAPWICA